MNRDKEDLLKHYASCQVQEFYQFDGWDLRGGGDDVMQPDDDGHWLAAGSTTELRGCGPDLAVRIHIHKDAQRGEVIALMRKLTDWADRFLEGADDERVGEIVARHDAESHARMREDLAAAINAMDERDNPFAIPFTNE